MNKHTISTCISGHSGVFDFLRAAGAELDAIVTDGLVPGTADRLNGVAPLVEEVLGQLEEPRP